MVPSDLIRPDGTALSARMLDDLRHGAEVAADALSARTREVYAAEWKLFEAYCSEERVPALPTTSGIVLGYLSRLSRLGRSVSKMRLARAAIKHYHGLLPAGDPGRNVDFATDRIADLLAGAKRRAYDEGKGNQAEPFLAADWDALTLLVDLEDRLDLRDVAMIGLGLVAAMRGPSELLALDREKIGTGDARGALALAPDGKGGEIALRKSKTSQLAGQTLPIHEGPVLEVVRRWIETAGIEPGTPLWRPIIRGVVQPGRLSGRALQDVVQRRAAQLLVARGHSAKDAGELAKAYSTHSLRRGALTSMGRNGATLTEIISVSRHSKGSAAIVLGYIKEGSVGADFMARKLGL